MIQRIDIAAMRALNWLKKQKPTTVKDISRSIQVLSLWNELAIQLIELLQSMRKDAFWETGTPLLDTARACSALAGCGMIQSDAIGWILGQQKYDNWNNNEIDTAYALIALGDSGVKNEAGCEWLFSSYGEKWEHVGTTALIITALLKQDRDRYAEFIKNRSNWIISKRESGGWNYIATSNLAFQALVLSGELIELESSVQWLLGKQNKDNWGDITLTALSLISLKLYLNKLI